MKYFKTGVAVRRKFNTNDSGLFMMGELGANILISAEESLEKQIGTGPLEEYSEDYADQMTSFIPFAKIQIGYNLALSKRLSIYIQGGLDFRPISYTKASGHFREINRGLGAGVTYNFGKKELVER